MVRLGREDRLRRVQVKWAEPYRDIGYEYSQDIDNTYSQDMGNTLLRKEVVPNALERSYRERTRPQREANSCVDRPGRAARSR